MQLFTDRVTKPSQNSTSDLGHHSVSATTAVRGEGSCIDFSVLFPNTGSNLYSEVCNGERNWRVKEGNANKSVIK